MLKAHPEVLVAGALACQTTETGDVYHAELHGAVSPPEAHVALIVPCAAAGEAAANGMQTVASTTTVTTHRLTSTARRSVA
jgi:hypothetical protein